MSPRSPRERQGRQVNAETQRNAKTQSKVFSVFSLNFCVLCGFSSIGENLCQYVDNTAKVKKPRKPENGSRGDAAF